MKSHLSGHGSVNKLGRGGFFRWVSLVAAGAFAAIVVAMPYHAFFTTWFGALLGEPLIWKSWKEILLGLAIIALLAGSWRYGALYKHILKQRLTKLILLYAGLHVVLALIYQPPLGSTLAGLMTNLRFLAIFLVAQMLVGIFPVGSQRLRNVLTKSIAVSGIIVAFIGVLQVTVLPQDILQHFGYDKDTTIAPYILVDENEGALRAFSTMRGPNTLGMFLILPLTILAALVMQRRYVKFAVPGIVLCLWALVATGSRSAWIGALVAVVVVSFVAYGKARTVRLVRRYGVLAALAAVAVLVAATSTPALRLAIFHSSPDDPHLTEGSTDKHFQATLAGTLDAVMHPLGRGPGEAGPASFYSPNGARIAENYYVQLAQEVGIVGLILFVAIMYYVARRLWRITQNKATASPLAYGLLASFWGIVVINLFLHGWADDPTALIWWALAGLLLGINADQDDEKYEAEHER